MKIEGLNYNHGTLKLFNNFNLSITNGKVTSILGPSGCGKTTLLNIIAGAISSYSGKVILPPKTTMSYIFQDSRLLPWRTVKENIQLVLEKQQENQLKVNHYLKELELYQFKNYYPHQLSGGMKQRCSIARAFAFPSNMILMDEPFKGLDLALKLNLIDFFNRLWREDERTSIFVTHDIQDALLLGDEIIVLSKKPTTLFKTYKNPLDHSKRNLNSPALLSIERKLRADVTKNI